MDQQQLRGATGRPSLYDPALLVPALETFARGLPFGGLQAPEGTVISISVRPPANIVWILQRTGDRWSLWSNVDRNPATSISVSADLIWLWAQLGPVTCATRAIGDNQGLVENEAVRVMTSGRDGSM